MILFKYLDCKTTNFDIKIHKKTKTKNRKYIMANLESI